MEAFAHTLLRPTRRITRAIAATVVLALVAWLGVSATHLHLPGPVESHATLGGSPGNGHLPGGHACAHAHAHAGHSGQSLLLVHIGHLGASSQLGPPGDAGHPGDDGRADHDGHPHPFGDREHHPGTHPCSLCLSLDRGAGPSAPPAIVVAIVAATFDVRVPDDPVVSVASPAVYRSRAPPVA
jgi:hypothetical protein